MNLHLWNQKLTQVACDEEAESLKDREIFDLLGFD